MSSLWDLFECQRCGKCCTRLPRDPEKLKAIADFLEIQMGELIERYYGRIFMQDGISMVEWQPEKQSPCPFLKADNTCSIYPVRPLACQIYPIETDGGRAAVACPGLKLE